MVRQKSKARRTLLVLLVLTALTVCTCLAFSQGAVYAEGGPVITRQPESVEVNYPDGACLQNCPFGAIDPCTRAQIVTFLYLLFAE